jgi:glycerophosphoryl diester phosphodiesterase
MQNRQPQAQRGALRTGALLLSVLCATAAFGPAQAASLVERPIVIAHRGASGYLPEHTMEAYRLAVAMGADFIEPDLFLTADNVLVARHDRNLNATTNAGSVNVDSLSFAQVQALEARSRGTSGYATPGNGYYTSSDVFKVPAFGEVLDYVHELYLTTGKVVGIYPEVKQISGSNAAAYHQASADAVLAALADPKYGNFFDGHLNNVFLQSFDQPVIQYLNTQTNLPLVFLTGCPSSAAAATAIKAYADGIGMSSSVASQACIDRAHDAGLLVHVYTLTNVASQYETFYGRGVDGIFGNMPDVNREVRDALFPVSEVPEPASAAMFAAGALGLLTQLSRRRRG